jgi:hypothetical protein
MLGCEGKMPTTTRAPIASGLFVVGNLLTVLGPAKLQRRALHAPAYFIAKNAALVKCLALRLLFLRSRTGHELVFQFLLIVLRAKVLVCFTQNVRHVAEVDCDVATLLLQHRKQLSHFPESTILR